MTGAGRGPRRRRLPSRALRTPPALLAAVLAAATAGAATADPAGDGAPRERPTAGGMLAWLTADDLDLVGDMRVDLPRALGARTTAYFALSAVTTIRKTAADFTFLVQDVDYAIEVGLRDRSRRVLPVALSWFAGQSGTQVADADGQPWVRYVGLAAESPRLREQHPGVQWRLGAGAVLDEREVRGDAIVRGELSWSLPELESVWSRFGLDVRLDGLVDRGRLRGDWSLGPRKRFALAGGRSVSLFAHYRDSDNPLGLGASGFLIGVDVAEARLAAGRAVSPPDVGGSLAFGGGEGRMAGRFDVRLLSPSFAGGLRGVVDVDANVLTARENAEGELYYFYHVGVERFRGRYARGVYLYHRSNHRLAEANDRITSINVAEVGIETEGWDRPGLRLFGVLDARLRVGYLLSSSFGERRRWHARGGLRASLPLPRPAWSPFVIAEAEQGDVERRMFALGLTAGADLEFRLEYRRDDQYFGPDKTAVLLTSHLGF